MASDNESTEALMTTMTLDDEIVVGQPVIDGTNVLFYVADTAKAERLTALVPTDRHLRGRDRFARVGHGSGLSPTARCGSR